MKKLLRIVGITNFSLFLLLLSSPDILSQNITNLSDEFLEGLPPSVREQIEVQNEVNAEKEIEDLYRQLVHLHLSQARSTTLLLVWYMENQTLEILFSL